MLNIGLKIKNKRMKKANLLVPFFPVFMLLVSACSGDEPTRKVGLEGLNLSASSLSLKVSQTGTITATTSPEGLTEKVLLLWTVSNPRVASVKADDSGKSATLNALAPGSATLTASNEDGSVKATAQLEVSHVALETIRLNETVLSLKVGETRNLRASVSPENITEPFEPVWTSSDEKVATIAVDKNDKKKVMLTALAPGSATVTVANSDASVSASTTVEVEGIPLQNIALRLKKDGDKEKVYEVVFTPANASNKKVTWTSSNEATATVSEGTVTSVGVGSATITATAQDGGFSQTVDLKVNFDKNFDKYCPVNGTGENYYPATVKTTGASTNLNYKGKLPSDYYDHYTAGKVSVARGGSFNLSLTQGSQWALTLVYFDWDGDGTWDVASTEQAILFGKVNAGTATAGETLSKKINVPASAVKGMTRMRITTVDAWTTDISTATAPCGVGGKIRNSSTIDFNLEIL